MITVIMPTWNRFHTEKRAIDSLLDQTDPRWELWITDASDPDHTELQAYLRELHDDRISYMHHTNVAPQYRRKWLSDMVGEKGLVAFLDSDDYYAPDRILEHSKIMNDHPLVGLAWDNFVDSTSNRPVVKYEHGRVIRQPFHDGFVYPPRMAIEAMRRDNFMHMSCFTVRSWILKSIGGYPSYSLLADWLIGVEVGLHHPTYFIDKPLSYRTEDAENRISTLQSSETRREWYSLHNHYLLRHPTLFFRGRLEYFLTHGRKARLFRRFYGIKPPMPSHTILEMEKEIL